MTAQEFNDQFDVLYNNITSNQAPGLDEYEKSVFLTKAQDEIIKNYFLRQSNPKQAGFDNNQKRQADFSNLLTICTKLNFENPKYVNNNNAKSVDLPKDVFLLINEKVGVGNQNDSIVKRWLVVKPISFDEYDRLMQKPFKYPVYNQAWRLEVGCDTFTVDNANEVHDIVDLVIGPSEKIIEYKVRYIRKPKPIIVANLSGVQIDGLSVQTQCELDESIHQEILQRAVELAKISWANGNDNTQMLIQTGARSE